MAHVRKMISKCLLISSLSFALSLIAGGSVDAQGGVEQLWSFHTGGSIFAAAVVDQGVVYVGSMDSCLYALSIASGTQVWKFNAHRPVQSRPLIAGSIVCFEGTNQFWGLDKATGSMIWHFAPTTDPTTSIDDWDYHHSSPVLIGSTIYVGGANGKVYGLNPVDGTVVFEYSTGRNSPIRTDITFEDSTLYFGDMDGIFDAVDMRTKNLRWSEVSTNTSTPNLSPMTSDGRIFENILIFGGRSTRVIAKDKVTGTTYWTYTDPGGSWMIADPIIKDSILYMGGSDNRAFFAFGSKSGRILWRTQLQYNMLCAPYVGDSIIATTMENANNVGPGSLVILDRTTGAVRQWYRTTGNTVSSPAVDGDVVYFGTNEGVLYAVKGLTTVIAQFPNIQMDTRTLSFPNTPKNLAGRDTSFYIQNRGDGADTLTIRCLGDVSAQSAFSVAPAVCRVEGHDSVRVEISVVPSMLTAGRTYMPYISVTSARSVTQASFQRSLKIKILTPTGMMELQKKRHEFRLDENYPNPFNPATNISYSIPEASKVEVSVSDITGCEVARLVNEFQEEGEHSVRFQAAGISSGVYFVKLTACNRMSTRKICYLR